MTPEELAVIEAEADEHVRDGYVAFDQRERLGPPPYERAALDAWESAHGHDVRSKCYPEFGCQVVAAELAEGARRLIAEVRRLTDQLDRVRGTIKILASGYDNPYAVGALPPDHRDCEIRVAALVVQALGRVLHAEGR